MKKPQDSRTVSWGYYLTVLSPAVGMILAYKDLGLDNESCLPPRVLPRNIQHYVARVTHFQCYSSSCIESFPLFERELRDVAHKWCGWVLVDAVQSQRQRCRDSQTYDQLMPITLVQPPPSILLPCQILRSESDFLAPAGTSDDRYTILNLLRTQDQLRESRSSVFQVGPIRSFLKCIISLRYYTFIPRQKPHWRQHSSRQNFLSRSITMLQARCAVESEIVGLLPRPEGHPVFRLFVLSITPVLR